MMFKKLYGKIDRIVPDLKACIKILSSQDEATRILISDASRNIEKKLNNASNASKTIESQQRTIEQLTNALKDKYEHGLFIFSEDCKIPMVIRNGKELTNELTTHFSIEWNRGETPLINIEQAAGTVADSEH